MLLEEHEITERLGAMPEWRREGKEIVRDYRFEDFAAALAFVNRVGEVAESADHHPDILLHDWNRVQLRLTTHSAKGLTAKDFSLARVIDGEQ